MAKKIVYKVVGFDGKQRVSIWVGAKFKTRFSLTYKPGEVTKAQEGLAIFAFKTLDDAMIWVYSLFNICSYEIWKCEATVCKRQKGRAVASSIVVDFKGAPKDLVQVINREAKEPVMGTVFCSSIKLLEKVR